MDKFQFTQPSQSYPQNVRAQQPNIFDVFSQAKQNPQAFEEHVRRNNPQAYQQALQIRNSIASPQQAIMQLAQQKGINPNILRMFDM